jgi:hypothetical protein
MLSPEMKILRLGQLTVKYCPDLHGFWVEMNQLCADAASSVRWLLKGLEEFVVAFETPERDRYLDPDRWLVANKLRAPSKLPFNFSLIGRVEERSRKQFKRASKFVEVKC